MMRDLKCEIVLVNYIDCITISDYHYCIGYSASSSLQTIKIMPLFIYCVILIY